MTTKNINSWANYDAESSLYFENYNKVYFSNVHRQFVSFLPKNSKAEVLDIGCGSGRDALSLARRGYQVTAIDPSIKMLELAQKKNKHRNIRWLNDSLPELSKLTHNTYDFVLMSAVWMHIAPWNRNISIQRVSELLKAGSRLAITLRIGDPDPKRLMYSANLEELLQQAADADLSPIYISRENKDSLNRKEVTWRKIVFQKKERSTSL